MGNWSALRLRKGDSYYLDCPQHERYLEFTSKSQASENHLQLQNEKFLSR